MTPVQVAWTLLQRCASADAKRNEHNEFHNSDALVRVLRRLHPKGLFRVDAEMTEDPGGLGKCLGQCVAMRNAVIGIQNRWNALEVTFAGAKARLFIFILIEADSACQVLVRERHKSSYFFLKPNLANLTVCSMVFFLLISCNIL